MSDNKPNSLIDPQEAPCDNISNIITVLRFLEETAQNYGEHVTNREVSHTYEGWNGFAVIMGIVREAVEQVGNSLDRHE